MLTFLEPAGSTEPPPSSARTTVGWERAPRQTAIAAAARSRVGTDGFMRPGPFAIRFLRFRSVVLSFRLVRPVLIGLSRSGVLHRHLLSFAGVKGESRARKRNSRIPLRRRNLSGRAPPAATGGASTSLVGDALAAAPRGRGGGGSRGDKRSCRVSERVSSRAADKLPRMAREIVVGVSGASGALLARRFVERVSKRRAFRACTSCSRGRR